MNTNHQARYQISCFLRTIFGRIAFLMLLLIPFLVSRYFQQNDSEAVKAFKSNEPNRPRVIKAFGKLPMRFEMNQGQTDDQVKFLSRGKGYTLFLTPGDAVLTLRQNSAVRSPDSDKYDPEPETRNPVLSEIEGSKPETVDQQFKNQESRLETEIHIQLVGANLLPQSGGEETLITQTNYFIGNDPKNWRTAIPNYAKVRYQNVYPGIDVVYHGNEGELEFDFIVKPGGDPRAIALAIHGIQPLRIDEQGDLRGSAESVELKLIKPKIYQKKDGKRQRIDGKYQK